MATTSHDTPRTLAVGDRQAGTHVAARLRRRLLSGEATITVVDPHSDLTCQPPLAEAARAVVLVPAPGSVTQVLAVPGLAESGIGSTTASEATHVHNHVLARNDFTAAANTTGPR